MNYNELRALLFRRLSIPKEEHLKKVLRSFSIAERFTLYAFIGIFILSSLFLILNVSNTFLKEVPTRGGTLVEGIIGNPRFINPVLALSEADRSLTALVYSGLLHIGEDGVPREELASQLEIGTDGLTYTLTIDEDAYFHDGEKVEAEDVLFTVTKILDPLIKSPRRGDWDGVTVEEIDRNTVVFHLKKPYAPFIENLTVGILPKHIWQNVSNEEFVFSQWNTLPIGSGPYRVESVERNSGGIPDYYKLVPFENLSRNGAYIDSLVFRFFPNEDALLSAYKNNEIESFGGINLEKIESIKSNSSEVISAPLPRVFAVFFNQNQAKIFSHKEIRKALELASPKQTIVDKILRGHGTVIDSPIPAGIFDWNDESMDRRGELERLQEAEKLLEKNGWKKNENGILEKKIGKDIMTLSFSISTGDAPELKMVAEELLKTWGAIGADVRIITHETGELNQSVIRPRQFDALLFGEVVGRDADVYPFWHSSQRTDPGLNIALYANSRVDKLIGDARATSDRGEVENLYKAFVKEIREDVPAVFLYTPSFLYVVPNKVKSLNVGAISTPQDRFLNAEDWYIDTDKVWNIFTNN